MSSKLNTGRKTPPDDDDWEGIWSSLQKSNRMWPIVAPIVAVVENWKALCVVGAIILFIRGPDLIAAIVTLLGTKQ